MRTHSKIKSAVALGSTVQEERAGPLSNVLLSNSWAFTPSPSARISIKCRLGCVSPRSSLEIEETSQRQTSANAACESPCSSRISRSAVPNASSVFKRWSIAVIDRYSYRNIFLVMEPDKIVENNPLSFCTLLRNNRR